MKTIKHLFTALLLLCATVATAHDFEVDGIYYNITDATNKTVEVTYKGTSYSQYSYEYTGDVVIPESVTLSYETFDAWTSTNKSNSTTSQTSYILNVEAGNILKFDWSVSSESGCDWLVITLDGAQIIKQSGTQSDSYEKIFDTAGSHTLVVKYTKDSSRSSGNDEGKIYNIILSVNDVVCRVTSIGEGAFSGCSGLTSIKIPNSVTTIGNYAFEECSGLTSIVIPDSVTSIGNYAFAYCSGLTSIVIPNSVTSIGNYAFYNCYGLASVEFNAENCTNMANSSYPLFSGCTALSTVIIGENVKTIPSYAFYDCSGLTSIVIPDSVTSIGNYAFAYCSGLTSIVIPNSVTSIGNYAFYNCYGLASVEFNAENCTNMANSSYPLFSGCTALSTVIIGENVKTIPSYAFYDCSGLTSIEIPNNVTSIGNYAFNGCASLKELHIEDGERTLSLGYNTYYSYGTGEGLFYDCPLETLYLGRNLSYNTSSSYGFSPFYNKSTLTSATIGNSVTSIGNSAFHDCSGLKSIEIPNSVTSIGERAFCGCSGLTSIVIPNSVTSIGNYAFNGCSSLKKAIWLTNTPPSGYKNVGATYNYVANNQYSGLNNTKIYPYLSSMFEADGVRYVPVSPAERTCDAIDCAYNDTIAVDIVIGKTVSFKGVAMNVKEIMPYTLYANKKIKSVKVENEGNIGNYAFSGCTALTTATISNEGNVGSYAFSGCTALITANVLNEGNIGDYAFKDSFKANDSIAKVIISNKGSIGQGAFSNCSNLVEATLGDSVTSIGASAFYSSSSLRNIVIPDNVATLGNEAFYNCSSLESAKIGTGITAINEATFSGCSAMTSITIGNNVKTIGKNAFNGCSLLSEITIPQSVTEIKDYAFDNCSSLADVIIEDKTKSLSLGSNGSSPIFSDCPLDSVYISCKITYNTSSSYGYSPFYRNTSLRTVVITDTETEIYDNEFYGCSNLKDVSIGNGVNKIGKWAFSGCSGLDYFAFGKNVRSIGEEAFSDCNNVSQIISRAKIAPVCGTQALDDINKWSCTLLVPENYKSEYQAAEQWKEFFFIEGIAAEMYTVTFVVDGEIYDTVSVEYGEVIALPETPTKEGHTFSGWSEMPETMPAEDITIEGTFTVNHYTVTYVVDGEVYATDSIAYGNEIILIDEPTKEGHTFSGWSEAPATMPAEDVTIEGTFTVNHYTVTYVVDGEVYATDSIAYGSEIILIDEPTKEGHTFSGWSEMPETMPAEDITVTGSFSVNSYNVTFVVDEEVYKTVSVNYGETIPMPEEPVKDGCTFSGWSEIPVTMPAEDITITGSFYANYYTLTYMVDGEVYATVTVGYNSVIPEMEEPTKEGHTFSGWENVPETMPAQDITIIGSFTVNSYNAIFLVDNALYAMLSVNYGKAIELPEPPSKEGFVFDGWEGLPVTMPAKDIVLIAIFTDVTGVDDVKFEIGKVKTVYDLSGRVVENPTNGIYIINGKKVLVK